MAMLKSCLLLFIIFSMGDAEVNVTRDVNGLDAVDFAKKSPARWINFELRSYKYFSQTVNWITAERNCQGLGANLASVHNQLENDFLLNLLPSYSTRTWIGAHDGVQDGHWLWSDGSVFLYTHWCTGEPNNSNLPENCLEISYSSNHCWNDRRCSSLMPYICVKDL